ncbi:PP2C family serine/threonine-protein phosphatase, partial [Klebsiella pneumoniae]
MAADRTAMMSPPLLSTAIVQTVYPKFGMASICGRRRDMEDAVAVHPFFCRREHDSADELHYFGVYDGHGGSHVCNSKINHNKFTLCTR